MTKIVKATERGQITLPANWRRSFNTDRYIMKSKGNKLEVTPFYLEKADGGEYTVFDAIRDNGGKGIKAKDLAKMLKSI